MSLGTFEFSEPSAFPWLPESQDSLHTPRRNVSVQKKLVLSTMLLFSCNSGVTCQKHLGLPWQLCSGEL